MGGNNLAIIPSNFTAEAQQKLTADLEYQGFKCMNFKITSNYARYEVIQN